MLIGLGLWPIGTLTYYIGFSLNYVELYNANGISQVSQISLWRSIENSNTKRYQSSSVKNYLLLQQPTYVYIISLKRGDLQAISKDLSSVDMCPVILQQIVFLERGCSLLLSIICIENQ